MFKAVFSSSKLNLHALKKSNEGFALFVAVNLSYRKLSNCHKDQITPV